MGHFQNFIVLDVCMSRRFSRVWLFATLWTVACQGPLSMRFSRQEYWSGLPCPPPGDLPNPGVEPTSPVAPGLQVDSLLLGHQGSPSVSTDLSILDISYKRKNSIRGLFCFTLHGVFQVRLCCSLCQCFIPVCDWIMFYYMDLPQVGLFICLF